MAQFSRRLSGKSCVAAHNQEGPGAPARVPSNFTLTNLAEIPGRSALCGVDNFAQGFSTGQKSRRNQIVLLVMIYRCLQSGIALSILANWR